jgi:hypothetical protein
VWNRWLVLCLNFSHGREIRFQVTELVWVKLKQTWWTKIVQRCPFRFIRLPIRNVTQVCENYRQDKWMYFCGNLLSESPFDLTARDSVVCQQLGTSWRCDTRQSIMWSEGERWSSVVHHTEFVTILWQKYLNMRICDSTGYSKEDREKSHSRQLDTLTRRVFSTPDYVWNVTATWTR